MLYKSFAGIAASGYWREVVPGLPLWLQVREKAMSIHREFQRDTWRQKQGKSDSR
jgi:hypothetical protein